VAVRRPTLSVLPDPAVVQEWQMAETKPARQVKSVFGYSGSRAKVSTLKLHYLCWKVRLAVRVMQYWAQVGRCDGRWSGEVPTTAGFTVKWRAIFQAQVMLFCSPQRRTARCCKWLRLHSVELEKKWKDAVMARRYYTDIHRRVWQKPSYLRHNPLAQCRDLN